eukprot:3100642-Pleurochrysis_carterae.AAC.1
MENDKRAARSVFFKYEVVCYYNKLLELQEAGLRWVGAVNGVAALCDSLGCEYTDTKALAATNTVDCSLEVPGDDFLSVGLIALLVLKPHR